MSHLDSECLLLIFLFQALKEEGHDPETYLLEVSDSSLVKKGPVTKKSPRELLNKAFSDLLAKSAFF